VSLDDGVHREIQGFQDRVAVSIESSFVHGRPIVLHPDYNGRSEMTPFELTHRLMSIPSVTGTEGEIGRFLSGHLRQEGYEVETQEVSSDRVNVIARAGPPDVVFCTHIDTVPPLIAAGEDDDTLFGRGACDAKGIVAAMLEAGNRLRREGIARFGFLFLVGEETGGDGAKRANTLEWSSRYVVVGEPTGNTLARAQKGTLLAHLTIEGVAAHSGYPETGRSALHPMIEVLHDCVHADWGEDSVLGAGSCNVGVVRSGERANILAPEASASIMLRTVEDVADARARLDRVVGGRARIDVQAASAPQMMHVVDGFPQTVVSFGSDVPYLGSLGKPLLVGPGSILDAHTAHEKILKKELMDGVDLYDRLARILLG
jgi:acetylornithine deacetylase